MFFARLTNPGPGRTRLIAGWLALALCATALPHAAIANDTSDPVQTGSIDPLATATELPEGSGAFRRALDAIKAGDYVAAYDAARSLPNDTERRTIQWAAIYYGGGAIDYNSVLNFSADAPDYAAASTYKTRLEQSLTKGQPSGSEVIKLLAGAMPNTLKGQIALAVAYLQAGERERATNIVRDIWINDFLDPETEAQVREKLGALLTRDDHWARAVHLMMHDRASGAERIMSFLSPGQQSLVTARNATSRKADNAKALLDAVDPAYQSHPVFLFSRAQRAFQAGLYESAIDWLNKAKGELPDAAEFWSVRQDIIRKLLAIGDAKLAYRAAATYVEGPEGRLVEARFHAGWIALSFLGDAAAAKEHFTQMAALSTLPDTVTQANYWLGRALVKLGDNAGAQQAFGVAAQYSTVYYGQLARAEFGMKPVELRPMPAWQDAELAFNSLEVIRAVALLAANGQKSLAVPLLKNYAMSLKDGRYLLLAARLAQQLNAHHVAISIADVADRRGSPLDLFSFPKDGLPANAQLASIDKAAIYAITRQESHFQVDAQSGVGARGLMQLMPGTAKETAAKLGLEYSAGRLTSDPAYNALLGSTYLAAQLKRYNGSLVLAAAAYNAGPGNADKWIAAYGDPRLGNVDPVVWVELIPFQETRKYVQRVLGNYMVYRARLGDESMTITQALRMIP